MIKHHPEQADDEIYLGNMTAESYVYCQWKTKRQGTVPIYQDGSPMSAPDPLHYKPIFIKSAEVENVSQLTDDTHFAGVLAAMLREGAIPF